MRETSIEAKMDKTQLSRLSRQFSNEYRTMARDEQNRYREIARRVNQERRLLAGARAGADQDVASSASVEMQPAQICVWQSDTLKGVRSFVPPPVFESQSFAFS